MIIKIELHYGDKDEFPSCYTVWYFFVTIYLSIQDLAPYSKFGIYYLCLEIFLFEWPWYKAELTAPDEVGTEVGVDGGVERGIEGGAVIVGVTGTNADDTVI